MFDAIKKVRKEGKNPNAMPNTLKEKLNRAVAGDDEAAKHVANQMLLEEKLLKKESATVWPTESHPNFPLCYKIPKKEFSVDEEHGTPAGNCFIPLKFRWSADAEADGGKGKLSKTNEIKQKIKDLTDDEKAKSDAKTEFTPFDYNEDELYRCDGVRPVGITFDDIKLDGTSSATKDSSDAVFLIEKNRKKTETPPSDQTETRPSDSDSDNKKYTVTARTWAKEVLKTPPESRDIKDIEKVNVLENAILQSTETQSCQQCAKSCFQYFPHNPEGIVDDPSNDYVGTRSTYCFDKEKYLFQKSKIRKISEF